MEPATATLSEQQVGSQPDHTQLPDEDGAIVHNFQEHPQGNLLTSSITPVLGRIHPDGQYCIGQDSGIYWRITQPPGAGCKAPDWFYVPGVPPMLEGQLRRSYVMWQEIRKPLLIIEFVSGDGSEEHDAAPWTGKFWVYEQAIAAPYYAIFDAVRSTLELYRLEGGKYARVQPNEAGRLPIKELSVELGIWNGHYRGINAPWARFWDSATGEMLPSEEERAEKERIRAETAEGLIDDYRRHLEEESGRATTERQRADREEKRATSAEERAARLAERLKALGEDPEKP